MPLCPPQIPHELTRARLRSSVVRGRRLITSLYTVLRSVLFVGGVTPSALQNARPPASAGTDSTATSSSQHGADIHMFVKTFMYALILILSRMNTFYSLTPYARYILILLSNPCLYISLPNVVVEWLTFMLRIREVPGSSLGDWDWLSWLKNMWYSWVRPGKYHDSALKLGHYHFLPLHLQFIIHTHLLFIGHYSYMFWVNEKASLNKL
jgi:hypothetical protein